MGKPDVPNVPEDLLRFIRTLNCQGTVYIAFSGGMDSTALLLAASGLRNQYPMRLGAIHVNHGAHAEASHWAQHCERVCKTLGVPFTLAPPPESPLPKDSPEAQWRRWRLEAFEALMGPDDIVLTAHHRQDQAESLLLALLRSSGPEGLAAMPAVRPLGRGRLARPFLNVPRDALCELVSSHEISFIEDPGNQDTNLDRNYLRHELMPVLENRWPAAERSLARSAELFARLSAQLGNEGALALAGREPVPGVLELGGLPEQPESLALVIRHWLRQRGAPPMPRARMEDLVRQLCTAGADRNIFFEWQNHHINHAQNRLWLSDQAFEPCPDSDDWDDGVLQLGPVSGTLMIEPEALAATLHVTSRQGGERYRSAPDTQQHKLKQWFNEHRLPAWFRDCVPLVMEYDRLLAVGDVVLTQDLKTRLGQKAGALCWSPAEPLLKWAWQECRRDWLQVE